MRKLNQHARCSDAAILLRTPSAWRIFNYLCEWRECCICQPGTHTDFPGGIPRKATVIAFGLGGVLLVGCSENNRVGNTGKPAANVPAAGQARDGQDATNTGRNVR